MDEAEAVALGDTMGERAEGKALAGKSRPMAVRLRPESAPMPRLMHC
jgi:hypothetical protein